MRIATVLFVVCAIGFVAADEPKKEETKLKGKWSAVSIKHAGQAAPDEFLKTFKFEFEDKTYKNVVNGEAIEQGDYTFDDSKSPKTLDLDIKKGPDEGKKQVGIFKIEGEKLTIVVAEAGVKDRPTSFKIEDGSSLIEAVFERVKP